jgi:hypothetical protein
VSPGSGGAVSSSATFFRSSPKERMTSSGVAPDDQVRKLKALLFQTQADERISFAEDFP